MTKMGGGLSPRLVNLLSEILPKKFNREINYLFCYFISSIKIVIVVVIVVVLYALAAYLNKKTILPTIPCQRVGWLSSPKIGRS